MKKLYNESLKCIKERNNPGYKNENILLAHGLEEKIEEKHLNYLRKCTDSMQSP